MGQGWPASQSCLHVAAPGPLQTVPAGQSVSVEQDAPAINTPICEQMEPPVTRLMLSSIKIGRHVDPLAQAEPNRAQGGTQPPAMGTDPAATQTRSPHSLAVVHRRRQTRLESKGIPQLAQKSPGAQVSRPTQPIGRVQGWSTVALPVTGRQAVIRPARGSASVCAIAQ